MQLQCSVLGKDVEITDTSTPVISPYWRLKRNGDWTLLSRYAAEQSDYSLVSPAVGATLSLMDGRLAFRHLCLIVQYAHGFENLEAAKEFVTKVIVATNKECDAVVDMTPELEPFVVKMDPLRFASNMSEPQEQKRPAAPLSLNLMFSNECETNCRYCQAQRRYLPENTLLPAKRWKEIIGEAKTLGIEQVTLSGGDPLYRKEALVLIGELIAKDMLFQLPTKCCITEEIADRLVEVGMTNPINQYLREIQLTIDGPDEGSAHKSVHVSKSVQSIRNLQARGFNFRVKAVATPVNASRIYPWIKQLAEMGVTQITVAAYAKVYHQHNGNLSLSSHDKFSIAQQCQKARFDFPEINLSTIGIGPARGAEQCMESASVFQPGPIEISVDIGDESSGKISYWKSRMQCAGGRISMTVTPDGKVVLCDTVPQDESFFVGDVSTQSLLEVWNSECLLNFAYPPREKFKGSACYDCDKLEECQRKAGHCFRDSYFNFGTIFGPAANCPMAQRQA
ncbi:radical SAM/SPASM domain-containing protein [Citrifermentans bremense]|uniref:radical SAM/SPASM domain-containing protein n=1 Tax=Citrifermentans bremense TaxID=60035 RepID=UPI00041AFFB2|nr:radical SAM protein [Citrifermentans bremense]